MTQKESQKGHRDRVRDRYLQEGLDGFRDYEILELLLFYAIPYKDTKQMAKDLLERFGSLHALLNASTDTLMEEGLTRNTAVLLNLIPQLARRYEVSGMENQTEVRSTGDAGRICCALFRNQTEESVRILCLSAKGKVLNLNSGTKRSTQKKPGRTEIGKGDINAVHFSVRKIVETALEFKAVSVILTHNHPGGTLTPSREDLEATAAAEAALKTVGIQLLDHLIVSGDDYCSLREEGYLG